MTRIHFFYITLLYLRKIFKDFLAFPQKFIDLLQQCTQEHAKEIPRFLLQLVSPAAMLDNSPAFLNVVETNPFKHLTHLSLKLLPGNDVEIKKFLAGCLKCSKELQRTKQEVLSLRRENSTLDAECHEKEKHINQLQTKVAVLEQEIKDKDQLVLRTKEAFDTIQEQKVVLEENGEKNQVQLGKLEATIKSLSAELLKANEIIKKLQGDLKTLMGKLKLKNTVTIQQEKLLAEKEEKLQKEQKELQDVEQSLRIKEQKVVNILNFCVVTIFFPHLFLKFMLLITWLNKELNENQLVRKQDVLGTSTTPPAHSSSNTIRSGISPNLNVVDGRLTYPTCGIGYPVSSAFAFQNTFPHSISAKNTSHPGSGTKVQFNLPFTKPNASLGDVQSGATISMPCSTDKENGEDLGLESKYLKKREDSIPLRGLSQNLFSNSDHQRDGTLGALQASSKPTVLPLASSAYFPGQLPNS
ncbi:hypothetical protein H8959_018309 [Pygathrix nigripes]